MELQLKIVQLLLAQKFGTHHEFVCHPCAGAISLD